MIVRMFTVIVQFCELCRRHHLTYEWQSTDAKCIDNGEMGVFGGMIDIYFICWRESCFLSIYVLTVNVLMIWGLYFPTLVPIYLFLDLWHYSLIIFLKQKFI